MDQPKVPFNNWIIWLALLTSVAFYAGIAVFGLMQNKTRMDDDTRMILTQALGGVALSIMALVTVLRKFMAKALDYQSYSIVRWALCESIAIFGLILNMMGASLTVSCAFLAASGAALLLTRPTEASLDDYNDVRK